MAIKRTVKRGTVASVFLCIIFVLLVFYRIKNGSFSLRYPSYGTVTNENSIPGFQVVNISFAKLSTVEDRLWVRHNFSDFTFRNPSFADENSLNLWYKHEENKGFMKAQPIKDFFTEVLYLRNGTIDTDKYCGYKGAKDWITQGQKGKMQKGKIQNWFPAVVPLLNRDGFSFQHFIDGSLHRIVQILPLVQNKTVKVLMEKPRDSILYDLLKKLRISSDQLVFKEQNVIYGADLMIHSCIRDTLHPTLWREARRLLGVPRSLNVPYNKAYVVMVTRDGCFNCGRRILNWKGVSTMLEARYGSDVIKIFKGPQTLDASLEIFGNSRIILGPHGGGLYNMNFAPHGTTVIEFMPTKEDGSTDIPGHQIFWKVANILYHDYWRVCLPPGEKKDMTVDLNILSAILDSVDGKRTI